MTHSRNCQKANKKYLVKHEIHGSSNKTFVSVFSEFDNKVGYFSCLLSLVVNVYKYEYAPLQDTIKMFTDDLLTLVFAFAIILHAFANVN